MDGAKNNTKKRIALIIANNSYINGGLMHPIPTAKRLESTLKNLGFDVLIGRDLTRKQMASIINDFSNKYQLYELALVAYMRHGFEIEGENFLIPIDAIQLPKMRLP